MTKIKRDSYLGLGVIVVAVLAALLYSLTL